MKQKFSVEIVTEFINGFKFCEILKLPKDVLFDASSFAAFLHPVQRLGLHFTHIL